MFIYSNAFLVQSRCGRLVILCYRGTEPTNASNWLTDADAAPEPIPLAASTGGQSVTVHGGFYRNVRATRLQVVRELALAARGRSLLDPDEKTDHPLEALYVTGHSLGGAMAVLFALTSPQERLRAVYTFGQPMVAGQPLPPAAEELGRKLFRHVAPRDPVPALPPASWGAFAHFGQEFQHSEGGWAPVAEPTAQMASLREISRSVLAFLVGGSRRETSRHSIDAHGPHRYLDTLRAAGRVTAFGD